MTEEILMSLIKMGPVVALLVAAVWYFLAREKKLEEEVDNLNKELRENEKQNVTLLYKVLAWMEKLNDK